MKLKQLRETLAALDKKMDKAVEERSLDTYKELEKEAKEIEAEIELEERELERQKKKGNDPEAGEGSNDEDEDTLEVEIRSAYEGTTEVDLSECKIEVRDGEMVSGDATGTQASTGKIAKMTFANFIIKRLPYISPLYARCRKEPLAAKTHAIPVQKKKLPKFVKMKELAQYAKETANYDQIKLQATKFGTLVVISDECIEDTGYDIVTDVKEQILEGYALTLEELIVVGDKDEDIQGLNSFDASKDGSHKITQITQGAITIDEVEAIYYAVPKQYRKGGTWVLSDDTARALNGLKYTDGKPLLKDGYNGKPFGEDSTLLGCPVIISEEVDNLKAGAGKKGIFFGDLSKAIIVGPRKTLTLVKSTEYGWIEDATAFKASVRLDIKKALGETMAYYELIGEAPVIAQKADAKVKKTIKKDDQGEE